MEINNEILTVEEPTKSIGMYNIFLRYYDDVKLIETNEEMFNTHNKIEHLARLQWDEANLFVELCDESDKKIIELVRDTFNIDPNDEIELEHYRPIGEDELTVYSNIMVINNSRVGPDNWGEDLDPIKINGKLVGQFIPWTSFCNKFK